MESAWKEKSGTGSPEHWQQGFNGIPRLLRDLELDWSTSLLLDDRLPVAALLILSKCRLFEA